MSNRMRLAGFGVLCLVLGAFVVPQTPFVFAQGESKNPKWSHAFNLSARKYDEKDFSDKTRRFGIEVFRDEYNGNLIYISETGSIAVVPAK